MDMPGFDVPAASQYAATTPELLAWFKGYNECHPEGKRVVPFGFLLSLQAKSRIEMAKDDPEALSHDLWRRREPRRPLSAHTLRKLRKGGPISDKSLSQLVRAAEQLRHETEPVAAVNAGWLQKLREFLALVGSQSKLSKLLGISRPYLGRVLRGEKPITAQLIERLKVVHQ
jgi:transcriptional regulator with XRE-family HTH domain